MIDLNLSPRLGDRLREAGHDAVHAADLDLLAAPDAENLEIASEKDRIVISADADFGTIIASTHASGPSVVFVRRTHGRRVDQLVELIVANVPVVTEDLAAGSIVVLGEGVIRVRRLAIL